MVQATTGGSGSLKLLTMRGTTPLASLPIVPRACAACTRVAGSGLLNVWAIFSTRSLSMVPVMFMMAMWPQIFTLTSASLAVTWSRAFTSPCLKLGFAGEPSQVSD